MIKQISYIFILGAGLMACSSVSKKFVSADNMEVAGTSASDSELDKLIEPYKDSIESEMNEVIAIAEMDYIVERPSGNLNNWVADAIFSSETKNKRLSIPAFCLLNTGGIRSTLNKGNITVGDIFKIAPFDNEIVWVRMPVSSLAKIEKYLVKSGGEPISNAQLADGKLILGGLKPSTDEVIIITSDYLFNGGDNMDFFKDNIEVTYTGKLLRDALIEEARYQEVLIESTETRISF